MAAATILILQTTLDQWRGIHNDDSPSRANNAEAQGPNQREKEEEGKEWEEEILDAPEVIYDITSGA